MNWKPCGVNPDLVIIDEVGMEDGDVEVWAVADLPQLLRQARLVTRVEDPVALDHEPAPHYVLLPRAFLKMKKNKSWLTPIKALIALIYEYAGLALYRQG